MKIPMNPLLRATKQLPDARAFYLERGNHPYTVTTPSQLSKVRAAVDEILPTDISIVTFTFKAENTVRTQDGLNYYDWVLIGVGGIEVVQS